MDKLKTIEKQVAEIRKSDLPSEDDHLTAAKMLLLAQIDRMQEITQLTHYDYNEAKEALESMLYYHNYISIVSGAKNSFSTGINY